MISKAKILEFAISILWTLVLLCFVLVILLPNDWRRALATTGFAIFFFATIIVTMKHDATCPVWKELVNRFGSSNEELEHLTYMEKRLFYRATAKDQFESQNPMKVYEDKDCFVFLPTISTFFLSELVIPKKDLEQVGKRLMFLRVRRIFQVKNSGIQIAII